MLEQVLPDDLVKLVRSYVPYADLIDAICARDKQRFFREFRKYMEIKDASIENISSDDILIPIIRITADIDVRECVIPLYRYYTPEIHKHVFRWTNKKEFYDALAEQLDDPVIFRRIEDDPRALDHITRFKNKSSELLMMLLESPKMTPSLAGKLSFEEIRHYLQIHSLTPHDIAQLIGEAYRDSRDKGAELDYYLKVYFPQEMQKAEQLLYRWAR